MTTAHLDHKTRLVGRIGSHVVFLDIGTNGTSCRANSGCCAYLGIPLSCQTGGNVGRTPQIVNCPVPLHSIR